MWRAMRVVIAVLVVVGVNSQCSADVVMPNIIKDKVILTNAFQGQEAASSFPYFSRMFSSKPTIAYSISSIDIASNGNFINYYLDIIQDTFLINIYFNAFNQQWNLVHVNILLTSHSDIIVKTQTLVNIGANQNATKVIPLIQFVNATLGISPTHIVFLVGLYSNITGNNLTVETRSGGVNPSFATIQVSTGTTTTLANITVMSVIYDPQNSQFLSYSGSISYNNFSQEYLNLYNNFVPIYNYLIGLSGISTSGANAKYYGYQLDLNATTVLSLSSIPNTAQYDTASFSYFTIGMSTSSICAKCGNNFISNNVCVDICPLLTYQHTFADGGKACLQCPLFAGLKINDLANGCNCLPGYQILTQHQCIAISSVKTNCTGNNVVQNGTQCVCAPGTHNISGNCEVCPFGTFFDGTICQQSQITCTQANTVLNAGGTACVCASGFSNYSGICRPTCAANSDWDAATQTCQCVVNFMNISGICQACKTGQTYDTTQRVCVCTGNNQVINMTTGDCGCVRNFFKFGTTCMPCPVDTIWINGQCTPSSCQANQILSNGKCICDQFSIKKGSVCIACQLGTFPNNSTQLCQQCMANCDNCTNGVSCDACVSGYVYDFSTKSCIVGGGSVQVSARSGFPVYTNYAIVTDFDVNSSATLAIKDRGQLAKMVFINFGGQTRPERVLYSQNPNNLNGIRVVLDYRGLLPLTPFNLTYNFQETSIGLASSVVISYNVQINPQVGTIPV